MDYISKNLGKNWHSFFRRLGYKQGQIETAEIDMAKYGVAEVKYVVFYIIIIIIMSP